MACGEGGRSFAGDLNGYSNPDKVKKRMGLMTYNGKAPSVWAKTGGLSKEQWGEVGYCPRRRSVMFTIGDAIIKSGGPYREAFDARKQEEVRRVLASGNDVVTTTAATAANWEAAGLPRPKVVKKFDGATQVGCQHIHRRAQRWMEQRLLIDLWANWTGNVRGEGGKVALKP